MTRTLSGVLATVTLATALATAQSPPAGTTASPNSPEARAKRFSATAPPTVTYAGCLKPGATALLYVLSDATEVAAKPGASASQPATAAAAATKPTFRVTGMMPPGVELVKHVNHRVEIEGWVFDAPAGEQNKLLNVKAFKHISPTCP
jgi:hypothetical protein